VTARRGVRDARPGPVDDLRGCEEGSRDWEAFDFDDGSATGVNWLI
jgi:hypothetical protein